MADNCKTPEIRDALLALFATATPDEVAVDRQWEDGASFDQLIVGRAKTERDFAAMGSKPVPNYELVKVQCGVGAIRGAKDSAAAALWEILDAAIGAIRQNDKLGVDGVQWARVSEIDDGISRTAETPAAEAKFVVEVRTRIYP